MKSIVDREEAVAFVRPLFMLKRRFCDKPHLKSGRFCDNQWFKSGRFCDTVKKQFQQVISNLHHLNKDLP